MLQFFVLQEGDINLFREELSLDEELSILYFLQGHLTIIDFVE